MAILCTTYTIERHSYSSIVKGIASTIQSGRWTWRSHVRQSGGLCKGFWKRRRTWLVAGNRRRGVVRRAADRCLLQLVLGGGVYRPVGTWSSHPYAVLATVAVFNESRIACLSSAPCCFCSPPSRTIPETHAAALRRAARQTAWAKPL